MVCRGWCSAYRRTAGGGTDSAGELGPPPNPGVRNEIRNCLPAPGPERDPSSFPGLFPAAFGYSRNAEQECAAYHKRTGRIIKLLTVQEILDEEHVQKM
jgi:hypothetical protein